MANPRPNFQQRLNRDVAARIKWLTDPEEQEKRRTAAELEALQNEEIADHGL